MTFLQPGILWGLLALAVPIIVHFFNLQRPKKVLFSNVAFVKEVKKTVVRRVRFKQWLLLLLRLLAITGLVLAFANPVWLSENTQLMQGNRSVALVLDNSYSMTAGNGKGAYFQQARTLARNILEAYSSQDEFLLMTTDDLNLNASFTDKEDAKELIPPLAIRQNIRSHQEILEFSDAIFSRASNTLQELYFISDFQQSTVMTDSLDVQLEDTSRLIKYIPLATREQQNVYIASHQVLSQIMEKGKPIQMSMRLVNDSKQPLNDLNLRVMLDGKPLNIATQQLEAEASEEVKVSFTPVRSGWQSGYIHLDGESIEFDNDRYFSLYVPEQEKILIVEAQASPNMRILYENLFNQFDASFLPFRNLASADLNEYRSVILQGVNEVSTGLAEKLESFLNQGGSLMFFPGSQLNVESVNRLYRNLGVGTFGAKTSLQEGKEANLIELDHPVFEGVFTGSRANREVDAPRVFAYHPLELNNRSIQSKIISIDPQHPILLESRIGQGLLYTFTLFPGDSWSDLHVKTLFAPLMFRTTQIMNQTQQSTSQLDIGGGGTRLIRTSDVSPILLKDEEGQEVGIPERYNRGGTAILNFEKMDQIEEGNYQLYQQDSLLEHLSFNIPDQESQLGYLTAQNLENQLNLAGLGEIQVMRPDPDTVTQQIQTEKEGIPFWKYFILLAIIALLTEIALLKFGKNT